jgi:hypothetical protein
MNILTNVLHSTVTFTTNIDEIRYTINVNLSKGSKEK